MVEKIRQWAASEELVAAAIYDALKTIPGLRRGKTKATDHDPISEHVRYYMPITSHDSGAPAQEFGSADSTVPRYVAAALLGTGATGIPEGVEFGETERVKFIGRQPKMLYPAEPRFAKFISRVNAILAEYPAFRRGENCQFVDNGHPSIIAAFRRDTGTRAFGFLVVCNFDSRDPQRIIVDLSPLLGTDGPFPCCELLSDKMQNFPHPAIELLVPPCAAQVLKFPMMLLTPKGKHKKWAHKMGKHG